MDISWDAYLLEPVELFSRHSPKVTFPSVVTLGRDSMVTFEVSSDVEFFEPGEFSTGGGLEI